MAAYVKNTQDSMTDEYITESTPFLRSSADVDCGPHNRTTGPSDFTISSLSYYDPYHDSTYAAQYLIPLKHLHESSYPSQTEDCNESKASCKLPAVTPGAVHTLHKPGNGQKNYIGAVSGYSVPAGTPTPPPLYCKPSYNHTPNKPEVNRTGSDKLAGHCEDTSLLYERGCQETSLTESCPRRSHEQIYHIENHHVTSLSQSPRASYLDPDNTHIVDPYSTIIPKNLNPSWKVDYLDFTPTLSGYDHGVISCGEGFSDQIKKANAWLRQNPQVDVLTCETLTWSSASLQHVGDSESMVLERAHNMLPGGDTHHVMGVRIWLVPKQTASPPQTLAYREYTADNEEKLGQVLQAANANLERDPLPGNLLSFETVMVPNCRNWDLNQVVWQETHDSEQIYQVFLRLFYVEGPAVNYKLGIRNIVPEVVHGNHEPFSCLMRRASQWVSSEKEVQVTNLRSTYVSRENDTPSAAADRCCHHFRDFTKQQYFQILRVFYICTPNMSSDSHKTHIINCMTFTPVQSSLGANVQASFEKMKSTMLRIGAWISLSGAKIFSLECVVTPLIPTQPNHTLPELTYWTQALTSSTETTRKKFLIHIRIYIDGEFLDPDPRLLPPLPYSLTRELQNSIEEKEIKRFYKKKKMRRTQNRIAIATFLFILVTVAIVIIIERMLKKYYL